MFKNSSPLKFLELHLSEVNQRLGNENLDLINKENTTDFIMSYSYGRALQQSTLKYWSKDINDIEGTQCI